MDKKQAQKYEAKFLSKIKKTDTCWIWEGGKSNGYGILYTKSGNIFAHRLSFLLYKGEIPHGAFICHNCPGGDDPSCVNPEHLWIGNHKENTKDFYDKYDRGLFTKGIHNEILRIRIPADLFKRFKIVCVENDLSIPKQTFALISKFIEIQEENRRLLKG